jgi:MFS transporter, OFA family, oxalate/formate antiporter
MNRYAILAITFVAQMCLGCSYAWSVFAMALKERYTIEPWQAMSFFSVMIACFAFTTLLSGPLQDRFGPRKVSIVGSLFFGAAFVLGGTWAKDYYQLLLTLGVMSGLGLGSVYPCILATCVKWFPTKKGLISGMAVSGYAFGAVCITWLAERMLFTGAPKWLENLLVVFGAKLIAVDAGGKVLTGTSVDLLLTWLGVVMGIIVLAGALSLSVPPSPARTTGPRAAPTEPMPWGDIRLWGLFGGFFVGSLAGLMVVSNMKQIGLAKGILAAAFGVMLFNVASAVGRISWGWISDRIGGRASMIAGLVLQGVAMAAILLFSDVPVEKKAPPPSIAVLAQRQAQIRVAAAAIAPAVTSMTTAPAPSVAAPAPQETRSIDYAFYLLAICVGFFYANNFSLYPAEVAKTWGANRMGAIYGVVFSAFGFAGLAGPTAAAWIFGKTGTYNTACIISAVLCLIGAGVIALTVKSSAGIATQTPVAAGR